MKSIDSQEQKQREARPGQHKPFLCKFVGAISLCGASIASAVIWCNYWMAVLLRNSFVHHTPSQQLGWREPSHPHSILPLCLQLEGKKKSHTSVTHCCRAVGLSIFVGECGTFFTRFRNVWYSGFLTFLMLQLLIRFLMLWGLPQP